MAGCADYLNLWPVDQQATAWAIAMAESGGRLDAKCIDCAGVPERSLCCWQINLNAHPQYDGDRLLSDPAYCAQAAYDISQGGANWHPWSTYTNGAYLAYLDQAPTAAATPDAAAAGAAPPAGAVSSEPPDHSGLVLLGFAAAALYVAGVL